MKSAHLCFSSAYRKLSQGFPSHKTHNHFQVCKILWSLSCLLVPVVHHSACHSQDWTTLASSWLVLEQSFHCSPLSGEKLWTSSWSNNTAAQSPIFSGHIIPLFLQPLSPNPRKDRLNSWDHFLLNFLPNTLSWKGHNRNGRTAVPWCWGLLALSLLFSPHSHWAPPPFLPQETLLDIVLYASIRMWLLELKYLNSDEFKY